MQRMPRGKWVVIKPEEPEEPENLEEQVAIEADFAGTFATDEAVPEPTPEPEAPPARSAFRRTMHYLWFGRG